MSGRAGGDRGSVLPLVLIFIVIVTVTTTALLASASTNFRSASATTELQNRVAAANAGLEYATHRLRTVGTTACGSAGQSADLGTLTVNGRSVAVTCTATSGSAVGAAGTWAVFVTDPAGGIVSSGNSAKALVGAVFNAGSWNVSGGTMTITGEVVGRTGAGCTPGVWPTRVVSDPPGFYGVSCVTAAPALPSPLWALPATVPPAAPAPVVDGNCTTFSPGLYTAALPLTRRNFFQSGIYVLQNADLSIGTQDEVVAGLPPAGTAGLLTPCARSGAVNGVVFVLAGSSRITLASNANFESHVYIPPVPATPELAGVAAPSVYQVRTSDPGPWSALASTVTGPTATILQDGGGSQSELAVRGAVFTPNARVELQATNASKARLLGGLVAARLDLSTSASASEALGVSTAVGSGLRDVTVNVVVDGGSKTITGTALLTLYNDPNRAVNVRSWVVDNA